MDKCEYQKLRFSVECHVAEFVSDPVLSAALANHLMRDFVSAMASSQVKQASIKRTFVTFRRDKQITVPAWAYRKPGPDSRLPRL